MSVVQESLVTSGSNPFPGLRSYEAEEADWFFGREDQIQDLLTRLRQARFVAVVGSSGCGKSSLVRAGVLPLLQRGFLASPGAPWRIAAFKPGKNPVANLADALLKAGIGASDDSGELASQMVQIGLRSGSRGVVELMRQSNLPPGSKLLVMVDQFEELFRFADRKQQDARHAGVEAQIFIELLLECARQSQVSIYVMLTMRSEFLADCTTFLGLPEAINEGLYLVPRLTRDQLREAIEEPVNLADGKIDNRLVNELLNGLGNDPDQLPILQHALMRLWNVWTERGREGPISLEDNKTIGGLEQALENHLKEIFDEQPEEQKTVELLFRELTQITEDSRLIRRPRLLEELIVATQRTQSDLISVIERYRQKGRSFLMPPQPVELQADTMIDISHESLIRKWTRLGEWVYEERSSREVESRLAAEALRWERGEKHAGFLITGVLLEQAKEWADRYSFRMVAGGREDQFLRASLAQRNREARGKFVSRLIAAAACILVAAIGVTIYALSEAQRGHAQAQLDRALALAAQDTALHDRASAIAASKVAEREKELALAAKVELDVTKGLEAVKNNDAASALSWFSDSVKSDLQDGPESVHRVRLAHVLRHFPRLEAILEPLAAPQAGLRQILRRAFIWPRFLPTVAASSRLRTTKCCSFGISTGRWKHEKHSRWRKPRSSNRRRQPVIWPWPCRPTVDMSWSVATPMRRPSTVPQLALGSGISTKTSRSRSTPWFRRR